MTWQSSNGTLHSVQKNASNESKRKREPKKSRTKPIDTPKQMCSLFSIMMILCALICVSERVYIVLFVRIKFNLLVEVRDEVAALVS